MSHQGPSGSMTCSRSASPRVHRTRGSMIAGMTTKIAVSLPDEQVAAARAAVAEGRAPSVSAYVSEALARRSAEEDLLELLEEDEAVGEPATEDHRAWARQALGVDSAPGVSGVGAAPRRERMPSARSPSRSAAKTAATGRHVSKATAARRRSSSVSEPTGEPSTSVTEQTRDNSGRG